MQTKTLFVTSLIVPLLLIFCSQSDQQTPLATGTSEEKQAIAPADPGKMMESSPPAAGITPAPAQEPAPAVTTPATPPSEPAKSGY